MLGVFLDEATVNNNDITLYGIKSALPSWQFHNYTEADQVAERIANADVVVTNKVRIDADTMMQCERLKLICVAATGTNNVDLEAAKRRGIAVCNVRGYATPSVVQHVFTMILVLCTRFREYQQAIHQGGWQKSRSFSLLDYSIMELAGKKLGIVGYGELGHGVAKVAAAFDMTVMIAQRPGSKQPEPDRTPLEDLLPQVDILTLHCPLTEQTKNLIAARELALMQPHAFLVNAARGGIVDEEALAQALRARKLGGAGIDVLTQEPPVHGNPLLVDDIPNLIVTPHIAWASRESRQRLIDEVEKNILAYLSGAPRNLV